MKASAQLDLRPDTEVVITLRLSVEEVRRLQSQLGDTWPSFRLRQVLEHSLSPAMAAYEAVHEVGPS
jgi:hypothetical protein